MRWIKQVLAVLKIGAKSAFTYRMDFIVSLFMIPIHLFVYYLLWKSIFAYSGQEVIRGYTFPLLISYFVVEMITSMLIWTNIDSKISKDVRKGKMQNVLLRPMDYTLRYISGQYGGKIVNITFQVIPILIIGFVFFNLQAGIISFIFIPVVFLAAILNFMLIYVIGMSAFWLKENRGIVRFREIIVDFVSGGTIPLAFLPLWFQSMSWFLPFQYIRYIPVNVFLGLYDVQIVILLMMVQICWIAAIYAVSRFVWKAGVNKYTGVGQ
jgi:ABC-2 type transport system permease protein